MITASVSGSAENSFSASMNVVADQRVTPDADARRLPHADAGQLVNRFVGQRTAFRDDANSSFLADVSWNDAGLRLPRRDHTGAIGPDEPRFLPSMKVKARSMSTTGMPSVMQTASGKPGVGRFHHGVGRKWRRHEDH
jgi:hypothetical protein